MSRRLRRRYGRASGGPWVPPAMSRAGWGPVALETLLTVAGWPGMKAPGPGNSVVFDRDGYGPLAAEGYIVLRRGTPGTSSFSDRYVLTDEGNKIVGLYRLHVRRVAGKANANEKRFLDQAEYRRFR